MSQFNVGDVVWAISPSVESDAAGDYNVREPYRVKILEISDIYLKCGSISEDGIVDDDTNATTYTKALFLRKNEKAAWELFIEQYIKETDNLFMDLRYRDRYIFELNKIFEKKFPDE